MAVEWHFPTPIFVHNFEGEQLDLLQTEISTARFLPKAAGPAPGTTPRSAS
jgi:hypothetical protein